MGKRLVCWFSCGAASAVATYFALVLSKRKQQFDEIVIAYTEVQEEHPDNKRFLKECEAWFDEKITILKNLKYGGSIVNVFESLKYMGGNSYTPCTRLLKKDVRKEFEQPNDVQVFGYTAEEKNRLDRFIDSNNIKVWAPLVDNGVTKSECLAILSSAGIKLPAMYELGYHNNNCIGCVRGGCGYWNKIRHDFPDVFKLRAEQSRRLGAKLCNYRGKRIYLDELPEDAGHYPTEIMPECGIACEYLLDVLKNGE